MNVDTSQPQTVSAMVKAFNDGRNAIAYRPSFSRLTGSVTAAILLQQISFRYDASGNDSFYKFKEPPKKHNPKYKPGDSWCEELAFTRSEFDTALNKIGTKITEGHSKRVALEYKLPRADEWTGNPMGYGAALVQAVKHLVIYWTDGNHVTYYTINAELLSEFLVALFDPKVEILLYLDKYRNRLYLDKVEIPLYLSSESTKELPENNTLATPPAGSVTFIQLPNTAGADLVVRDPIAEEIAIIDKKQRAILGKAEKLLSATSSEKALEDPNPPVPRAPLPRPIASATNRWFLMGHDYALGFQDDLEGVFKACCDDELTLGQAIDPADFSTAQARAAFTEGWKSGRVKEVEANLTVKLTPPEPARADDKISRGQSDAPTKPVEGTQQTISGAQFIAELKASTKTHATTLPAKEKKVRPTNPEFDAIAQGSFGLSKVEGKTASRIGGILKEVKACTDDAHKPTLAADLTAMYEWRKRAYPTLTAPTQGLTICKYLAEWRAAQSSGVQATGAADDMIHIEVINSWGATETKRIQRSILSQYPGAKIL